MRKKLIIDSVSEIDEDIIERYFNIKKSLKQKRINLNSSIKRWLLVIAACFVLVVSCVILHRSFYSPDIIDSNQKLFETIADGDYEYTIFNCFPTRENSSFVKIKINKVYDEVYTEYSPNINTFVLVEGIILEDYYNKIDVGSKITMPIHMSAAYEKEKVYFSQAELKEWFLNYEYMFVYLGSGTQGNKELRLANNINEIVYIESLTMPMVLTFPNIIPIKEGKIDLKGKVDFFESKPVNYMESKDIFGYDQLIWDKMEEEKFIANITEMYEYLLKNRNWRKK